MGRKQELEELFHEQMEEEKRNIYYSLVNTPRKYRHWDVLPGENAREKIVFLAYNLNWTDKMIARALDVSRRTVLRIRESLNLV